MRLFPFTLVKKDKLNALTQEYASLQSQIASAADFIREIEKGNLEATYQEKEDLSERNTEDQLADSLISLRQQMINVSLEEKQRSWVAETRSRFIDILRSKNNDLRELADEIICHLVKYLSANQGGLYLLNDDDANDVHIELLACYAYERKKHLSQRIEIGQGLVGQTMLEKESIYLTEIPENYLRITSGLGESTPRHLLIVPLKLEEKVFGAIEIASFRPMQEHEITFAEQLGESIASTIANVKNNQRTKKLLEETQQQTEEMRAQEEEVRQNMEELSATQEEMQRVMKEVQGKEMFLNSLINASSDSIFVIDKNYCLLDFNNTFKASLSQSGLQVEKGGDVFQVLIEEERLKHKELYDRVFRGEAFQVTEHITVVDAHYMSSYSPLKDEQGEAYACVVFAKDITELVTSRQQAEALLRESHQQGEELKVQEEELRQNMEELSATQEDMHRLMKEIQASEHYLKELLNVTRDTIYTLDKQARIITFNTYFEESMKKYGFKLEKGFDYLSILPSEEEKKSQQEIIDRVFGGETIEIPLMYEVEEGEIHLVSTYSPIRNAAGEIMAAAVYSKDITELVMARKQHRPTL